MPLNKLFISWTTEKFSLVFPLSIFYYIYHRPARAGYDTRSIFNQSLTGLNSVLLSSDRISSWTPLKPQHSNPNPNPLANQLWCIDFLTHSTPLIIPHRLRAFLESLMPLKNWCSMHARWSKSSLKHSIRLKLNFIAYRSSKVSDCIFKIHQLWQSGFSRVYFNSCCSCSFKPETIQIGQSSHKMYSNNIVIFQVSTTILNACTKKVWKPIECIAY